MAEQTNFGKGALITGIVLGVAAGAFGAYTMSSGKVERPQTQLSSSGSKAVAALESVAAEAEAKSKLAHNIVDVAPEGATINGKPRYTPIFFSPELWQITLDDEKKNTVIDIYDATAQNIHGSVPNHWFISNGIADALGRADGLQIDSDSDGFKNIEEFDAKTNPGDPKSHPALVQVGKTPKLESVKVTNVSAVIAVDSTLAFDNAPTSVGIKIFDKLGDTKTNKKYTNLKVGDTFGVSKKNDDEKRFTIVAFEKADFSDMSGNKSTESVVRVRDNVTAGKVNEFVIRSGTPTKVGAKDYGLPSAKGLVIKDTTVELRVTAGPKAGTIIPVRLEDSFTIPGTDITCKLESVDESGSVNVLPNGAESPVNVPAAAK